MACCQRAKLRARRRPRASSTTLADLDPPTATSWASCYTGMSPFFLLTGSPGDKVWIRIASVGKAPSAWSAAFLVILR
jgi:hypothetical protein